MDPQAPISGTRTNVTGRPSNVLPVVMVLLGLGLLLAAAGAFVFDRLQGSRNGEPGGQPRVGERMADFALTGLDGQTVRLSDYAGRPVLINTWATWCPPCRAEMPDLSAYYQANRENGFVILGVNAGEPRELAGAFAEEFGLEFPVLLDPDYALVDRLGIHSYPTSILIGRDGLVKSIHIGIFYPEEMEEEISPYLE